MIEAPEFEDGSSGDTDGADDEALPIEGSSAVLVEMSQATRVQLIRAGLPGMILFSPRKSLQVVIGRRIRWLRVYLPSGKALDLRRLSLGVDVKGKLRPLIFTGKDFVKNAPVRVQASLPKAKGRVPFAISRGKPYYEISFRKARMADRVVLTNTRSRSGTANEPFRVDFEGDDGRVWTYDNASQITLESRLPLLQAKRQALKADAWKSSLSATETQRLATIDTEIETLIAMTFGALRGEERSVAEIARYRLVCLEHICGFVRDLSPATKKEALPKAAAILDFLLRRGTGKKKMAPVAMIEVEAMAIILGDRFLRTRLVKNDVIRENRRFVGKPEHAQFVDRYVANLYDEQTGDKSIQPIMIRSHGLGGSLLLKHPDSYLDAVEEVHAIFRDLGYEFGICYGTLLGAVRDKGFIPHDDDVDTIFVAKARTVDEAKQEMDQLVRTLAERKIWSNRASQGFMRVLAPTAKRRMDVFPVIREEDDENTIMMMEKLRFRRLRCNVLPFGTIQFYDRTFPCPASPEEFLADRYGSTWRMPRRQVGGRYMAAGDTAIEPSETTS